MIPHFLLALLSFSKLTTQNNCCAIFFTLTIMCNHYVFQDMKTGMRIGSGCEREGLYYMDDSTFQSGLTAISSFDTPLQCIIDWGILRCRSYVK